jgi:hypothetical protein
VGLSAGRQYAIRVPARGYGRGQTVGTDARSTDRSPIDHSEEPHRTSAISVLDAWDRVESMYPTSDAEVDGTESHIFRSLD